MNLEEIICVSFNRNLSLSEGVNFVFLQISLHIQFRMQLFSVQSLDLPYDIFKALQQQARENIYPFEKENQQQ